MVVGNASGHDRKLLGGYETARINVSYLVVILDLSSLSGSKSKIIAPRRQRRRRASGHRRR